MHFAPSLPLSGCLHPETPFLLQSNFLVHNDGMTTAVAPPSVAASPYLDLPRANVRPHEHPFPPTEFVTIPNVPVFAEHVASRKDGTVIRFGLEELQSIADRCNRRIRETGDYATLCVGHTPAPGDQNGVEPECVGFAGPFRVGLIGESGAQHKYAILADFHVRLEDQERVKRYPRRSPELWLADDAEDMFLDPIALLGARPPRLDMGLLYAAQMGGKEVLKYTAVAPAATDVFVPAHDSSKPKEQYMLDPDEIKQILDALGQLPWVQQAQAAAATAAGPNTGLEPAVAGAPAAPAPPMAAPAAPAAPVPPPMSPPAAAPAPAPPPGPAAAAHAPAPLGVEPPVPKEGPPIPEEEKEKTRMAMPSEDIDPAKAKTILTEGKTKGKPLTDKQEGLFGAAAGKLKEQMDAMSDDAMEEYVRARKIGKYAAEEGSVEDAAPETPTDNATVENEPSSPGKGSVEEQGDDSEQYAKKERTAMSYDEVGHKLKDLEGQVATLTEQLGVERGKRVDAERYAALVDRRVHFALELDEEMERCCYAKMKDEQFTEHLKVIDEHYRRIPIGEQLPLHGRGIDAAASLADVPGGQRADYAKQHAAQRTASDKALQTSLSKAARGEDVDYNTELAAATEGNHQPATT